MIVGSLFRRVSEPAKPTDGGYIIVCVVHPKLKSPAGFYQTHPDHVWRIVKDRQQATPFPSRYQAELCAVGSNLYCYTDYRIELAGPSLPA